MPTQGIDEREKHDFLKALDNLGYQASDFRVSGANEPEHHPGTEIQPIRHTILIERASNGASRAYQAGDSRAWVAKALLDVESGEFGPP